jgi:competence protein ComEC
MDYIRKHKKVALLGVLIFINIVIWLAVYDLEPKDHITVSFLNVGQGDAELIQSSNGNSILIDGGPNKIVLSRLSSVLPFFQRHIDILIETHPDKDHIGGFPDVLRRYKVKTFLEPGVESPNTVDDEVRSLIKEKNISHVFAQAGQVIDMGDGAELYIIFPNQDVSGWDTNDASIVSMLKYGNTCFLFTGDSPSRIEDYLVGIYGIQLKCDVLKAGHHGSKSSTDDNYLNNVLPSIAVISAGKNNPYNHPNPETIDRLIAHNVKVLSTIDLGTIQMFSDGLKIWQK